jgi:hypothetical protein
MDQHYFKLSLLIYACASRDKGGVGVFKTNHLEQMTAIQVTIPHEKKRKKKMADNLFPRLTLTDRGLYSDLRQKGNRLFAVIGHCLFSLHAQYV